MNEFTQKFFDYLINQWYWYNTSRVATKNNFNWYIFNNEYKPNEKYLDKNIILDFSNNNIQIKKEYIEKLYQEFIQFCNWKEAITDNKTHFEKRLKNKSYYIYFIIN